MKRRVIKQGHNTLTITLPAKWAQKKGLNAGDEIELIENGNELLVNASKRLVANSKTFDIKNAYKYLESYPNNVFLRHMDVCYRLGYDELVINFDDARIVDFIQNETEFLLGFEIVEQGENYCIVRNIATGNEEEFDHVLRRIFLTLIGMANDSLDAIRKGEFHRLKNISKMEKINNRLTNFCERQLNKTGYKDYRKTNSIYAMVTLLEQICDEFNGICLYLGEFEDKSIVLGSETIKLFRQSIDIVESFYGLFYKFDRVKLYELLKGRHHTINNKALLLLKKQPKEESIVLYHLTSIVGKAYHLAEAMD